MEEQGRLARTLNSDHGNLLRYLDPRSRVGQTGFEEGLALPAHIGGLEEGSNKAGAAAVAVVVVVAAVAAVDAVAARTGNWEELEEVLVQAAQD